PTPARPVWALARSAPVAALTSFAAMRKLPMALLAVYLGLGVWTVARPTVGEQASDESAGAALQSEEEREGELTAPAGLTVTSVGPPLYDSHNTDGQAGSGGKAAVYRSGGRLVDDAAAVAGAPDAHLWRTGYGGWEPTLGLTRDGTIFFDARNSNADPGIVRSRDAGVTWENVNPPAHKVSLDPYLWVDQATGRIFDSDIDPTVTCPPLS